MYPWPSSHRVTGWICAMFALFQQFLWMFWALYRICTRKCVYDFCDTSALIFVWVQTGYWSQHGNAKLRFSTDPINGKGFILYFKYTLSHQFVSILSGLFKKEYFVSKPKHIPKYCNFASGSLCFFYIDWRNRTKMSWMIFFLWS